MRQFKFLRTFLFTAMLGIIVSMVSSCDDDAPSAIRTGTLHGVVTDEQGISLPDVVVSVEGMDRTAVTNCG